MASIQGDDGIPSGFTPNAPFGVWGDSGNFGITGGGNGVIGSSGQGTGVAGFSLLDSNRASGIYGQAPIVGIAGAVNGANTAPGGPAGVYGTGSNDRGLGATGVWGEADTGVGVFGESNSGNAVLAISESGPGVFTISSQDVGLFAISNGDGVIGLGGIYSGLFLGNVLVTGKLSKAGGGFKIDHPLDPENQYLNHSFVESPDMKNLYDGIAICDAAGEAIVELPRWFENLNKDFRYQLTPIGAPGPNLFVAGEVKDGKFKIGGGTRGLRVCWQVTGIRQDAWAESNRLAVEEPKLIAEKGRYLHAHVHGKDSKLDIHHLRQAQAERHLTEKKKK